MTKQVMPENVKSVHHRDSQQLQQDNSQDNSVLQSSTCSVLQSSAEADLANHEEVAQVVARDPVPSENQVVIHVQVHQGFGDTDIDSRNVSPRQRWISTGAAAQRAPECPR